MTNTKQNGNEDPSGRLIVVRVPKIKGNFWGRLEILISKDYI